METNTPIVPVGVVGCEEALPMYGNLSSLARMLSVPYIPITTPLPLPYKVHIHFGEPMFFEGPVNSEEQVANNVAQVRQRIESLLDKGQLMRQAGKSA